MTQINIHDGAFAGYVGELVEAGETTSKVKVVIFGRETVVDIPNDAFTRGQQAFDVFAGFEKHIAGDRRWEAGEATRDWWLAQSSPATAQTWTDHLQRLVAVELAAQEQAAKLLLQLKEGVADSPTHAEIDAYFREYEATFRPFRVAWRARQDAIRNEEEQRALQSQEILILQRVAYRAWWAAQPRPSESCREFLEAAWSGEDYQAMAEAEYEAFNRWGRDAVELSFNRWRDEPVEVQELSELPARHPWRAFIGLDPGEAVRQNLGTIAKHAAEWVAAFAQAVRVIYTIQLAGEYYLVYVCDKDEGYGERRRRVLSLVVGAPPLDAQELATVDDRLSDYERAQGWSVPTELRKLYAIHHGLGRLAAWAVCFDNAGSIYPAEQLSVLGEIMNSIAKDQNFEPNGFRFNDLLTFFEDGAGNGQNFLRHGTDVVGTVDWDHETREISPSPQSFWDFLGESTAQWWFAEG